MDRLKKNMQDIWHTPVNKTFHVVSYTKSILLKDIQNDG